MSIKLSDPIARELDDFWRENQSLIQQWQVQADIDTKMVAGMQDYNRGSFGGINHHNGRKLIFNKLLRLKNMVEGYQRDHRLATISIPGDNDIDQGETTDQLNTVLTWMYRRDYTYEKISDAFAGAITCGLNLMHTWMDFREDPENGSIRTERLSFAEFVMSPYWERADLSDCGRIWTRKFPSKDELRSLIPGIDKELPGLGRGYSCVDGKFQYMPQSYNQQFQKELYAYDEYWTQTYRTGRKLLDTVTGEVADWYGSREQFQMLRRINPNVKLIKAQIPTIKLHVLVNNQLIYEEKTPWGLDRMPFVPFVCYHYKEVQDYSYRFQGIIRAGRDPQDDLNVRINALRDVLDAQVQSGVIVKEDALVNPDDAFFQGPGKVMYLKQSANIVTDVSIIPPPPVAPGWMELIASIQKEIMDTIGPEELFAQNLGNKEMSGVLMKLKMGAGLTGLRNIFDRLNQSQMILGEIHLDMILNNFSVGKIQSILGKEPSKIISEATTPDKQLKGISRQFLKYNCAVEEAELTSTQRQLQFLTLTQLKQMNIPIPIKYIIEKSTLQGKKELIESIEQEEQQQAQMQQMQAQAELRQSEMVSRSFEAKAQSDFGRAVESRSRAVSDIALAKERAAQATHDLAKTALENAKALKEMEEIDEDRLVKLTNYILDMQAKQQMLQSAGQEGDSVEKAAEVSSSVDAADISTAIQPQEAQQQQQPSQPQQ